MPRITEGLDSVIDEFFALTAIGAKGPYYPKKTACNRLCAQAKQMHGPDLIAGMLAQVVANRKALTDAQIPCRGKKRNWRLDKQLGFAGDDYELRIQKAVAWLLDDWVNAVPTASGLTDVEETARGIDLVNPIAPDEATVVELKAAPIGKSCNGRQTPLFASMELLQYAIILLYSKKHMKLLEYTEQANPLLTYNKVHLEVLMTSNCYTRRDGEAFRLAWLDSTINEGLQRLQQHHSEIRFDFRFAEFPVSFEWTNDDHGTLRALKPNARSGEEWEIVRAQPAWERLRQKMSKAITDRSSVQLN